MLEKIRCTTNKPTKYFDFKDYLKNITRGQTPYTPTVFTMYELQDMLNLIENEGGLKSRLDYISKKCHYFRKKALELGLKIPQYPLSNALTPLYFENVDANEVVKRLRNKYNIYVNPCGGDMASKLLRVAHIGNTTIEDIDELLEKLILSIEEIK